jgi:hypothetical protein
VLHWAMAETVPLRVCKYEKIQALPEAFMSPMHDPRSVEMRSFFGLLSQPVRAPWGHFSRALFLSY